MRKNDVQLMKNLTTKINIALRKTKIPVAKISKLLVFSMFGVLWLILKILG